MGSSHLTNLRDFVYLDTDRVKSLVAQIQGGVTSEITEGTENSGSGEARAGFSIPALVDLGSKGSYSATNRTSETRTLHDFAFSEMEQALRTGNALKEIGSPDISDDDIEEFRNELGPVDYVLVTGWVRIEDFARMDDILADFKTLERVIATLPGIANGSAKSNTRNHNAQNVRVDKTLIDGIRKVVSTFAGERLSISIQPSELDGRFVFCGPLMDQWLREPRTHIRQKYGISPREKWHVFGQVASIPSESGISGFTSTISGGNEMMAAINTLISAVSEMDAFFQVKYPAIAFTPIAVYRG